MQEYPFPRASSENVCFYLNLSNQHNKKDNDYFLGSGWMSSASGFLLKTERKGPFFDSVFRYNVFWVYLTSNEAMPDFWHEDDAPEMTFWIQSCGWETSEEYDIRNGGNRVVNPVINDDNGAELPAVTSLSYTHWWRKLPICGKNVISRSSGSTMSGYRLAKKRPGYELVVKSGL